MRSLAGARRGAGFTLVEILVALLILSIMSALGYSTYRAARISGERTEDSLKRSREIEFGMRMIVQDFAQAVPRPVRDILGQSRLPAMRGTAGGGTVTVAPGSLGGNPSSGSSSSALSSSSPGMSFNSSSGFGVSNDNTMVPMIDLTRAGWSNTAGQQRGTLQRVSYALVGDVLKRSYQVNLDTVQANKPVVQDLLTGVKGVQLRYLDGNQTWQNQWPVSSSTSINSTAPTTPATTTTPGAPGAPGAPINSATADLQSRPVAVELIIQFKDWGAVRRLIEVAG